MYQRYNISYRSVSIIIAGLQTNIWEEWHQRH